MNLDWLSAYLIFGLFSVVMVIGLGLLLHLQMGLAGIPNFGIVGFWGLGMYAFGVAFVKIDWPWGSPWSFLLSLAIGVVAAFIAGLLIGWLIAPLSSDGILVGTLGFAFIVWALATTEKSLTGGTYGMGGLDYPYDIGSIKRNELLWLVLVVVVVAALLAYVARVHRSPYGRLLIAIGANEPLARSLGKPTFRSKLLLFALGAAGMGLLGAMYGVTVHYLTPLKLGIEVTLAAMVGLVLGGSARVWGAVIGVLMLEGLFDIVIQLYVPLPESFFQQALPVVKEMVLGAMLIGVLLFRPLGILGEMRRDKLVRRPSRG
jgi:branched-chain amino acid transport system permease protein